MSELKSWKKNNNASIRKNLLVIRHSYVDSRKKSKSGHVVHFINFLRRKYGSVYEIIHPFFYSKYYNSYLVLHDKSGSQIIRELPFPLVRIAEVLFYIKDIVATVYLVFSLRKKFDIIIAVDPLNTMTALFLRKCGVVNTVVFYAMDYTHKRFKNKLLNLLYQFICKKSATLSDCTWSLAPKIAEVWSGAGVPDEKNIVVPGGIKAHVPKRRFFPKEGKRLVYFGDLVELKGIELIVWSFPEVLKEVPDCKLIIIGTGELEGKMKKLVNELKIEENVEFLGFVPEYNDVLDILSECTIGLAPYLPLDHSYSVYTEPGKVIEYLQCGLPIIMTRVPEMANKIEKEGTGIVIEYDKRELVNAILYLLKNLHIYKRYRENVKQLVSKSDDWDAIFEKTLAKTYKCLSCQ